MARIQYLPGDDAWTTTANGLQLGVILRGKCAASNAGRPRSYGETCFGMSVIHMRSFDPTGREVQSTQPLSHYRRSTNQATNVSAKGRRT